MERGRKGMTEAEDMEYSECEDRIVDIRHLLSIIEDDMAEVLFVSIDRIDNDKDVVVAEVLENKLQDFFNSMEFVKE